ncbi:hypothetical protein E3E14_07080 [Streptomyces sp. ICN441]|uniref:hypothetical protein n=1 Tax=Streptomyces sp. ICN441 TaxID=2558286 RepID=UPI00106B3F06|nr:hypothetical protein [Streptomyces sp. ICN441]TFE54687.1 hypothetical protein E3E14_07080 [Streptomyces sp. ICN441]
MASSSDPWSERPQAPHRPAEPPQRSISEILGTPERPKILPGVTPSWPGHEYGTNSAPPRHEPIPGVPGAVRRQRAELEALRDDAARQYRAGDAARVEVYANHRKDAAVAHGVWAAAAWLLGELEASPISQETYAYPYTAREVGREETRALDCVERNAWRDVDEDYGAGVLSALEWATSTSRPRPVAQ